MLIGLVNAILVLKFISVAQQPNQVVYIPSAPALGFSVLLIPLLDTLRVFGIRIFRQRSPFSPDRNHIHHLMLRKGWSHNRITGTLAVGSILCVVLAYGCRQLGCTWVITTGVIVFFGGIAALYFSRRGRLFVSHHPVQAKQAKITRVIPLTKEVVLEQHNV
jgi:hypothetical protein